MWELTEYSDEEIREMWNKTDGEILDAFDICPDNEFWLELTFEMKRRGIVQIPCDKRTSPSINKNWNPSKRRRR